MLCFMTLNIAKHRNITGTQFYKWQVTIKHIPRAHVLWPPSNQEQAYGSLLVFTAAL